LYKETPLFIPYAPARKTPYLIIPRGRSVDNLTIPYQTPHPIDLTRVFFSGILFLSMKISMSLKTILISLFLITAIQKKAFAGTICTPNYGGGETCTETKQKK